MAGGQLFTQRTGYGVHALAYMGKKRPGELSTLPEIAEWMKTMWPGVSGSYLSNVIQRLARAGLLRSHRGVSGGYSLARPAEEMTLRDVVEILEGIDPGRCSLSLDQECSRSGVCSIQNRLHDIGRVYLQALEQLTIAMLAAEIEVDRAKISSS
jgi:Rrf2 family protein